MLTLSSLDIKFVKYFYSCFMARTKILVMEADGEGALKNKKIKLWNIYETSLKFVMNA